MLFSCKKFKYKQTSRFYNKITVIYFMILKNELYLKKMICTKFEMNWMIESETCMWSVQSPTDYWGVRTVKYIFEISQSHCTASSVHNTHLYNSTQLWDWLELIITEEMLFLIVTSLTRGSLLENNLSRDWDINQMADEPHKSFHDRPPA